MCTYKLQRALNDFRCLSISLEKHVAIMYKINTEKMHLLLNSPLR